MNVQAHPIGAPELVANLERALARLVGEVGEPDALMEALHITATLKLIHPEST